MSAVGWLVLGGVVWSVAAVWLGLGIGRLVKRRDEQKPVPPPVPVQRCESPAPPPQVLEALRESIRNQPPAGPRKGEQR